MYGVNGEYLGQNEGIFNSFEFEITHLVDIKKENTIIVRDSAPKGLTGNMWKQIMMRRRCLKNINSTSR